MTRHASNHIARTAMGAPIALVFSAAWLVGIQGLADEDARLTKLDVSLHTGNPIAVVEKGREDRFFYRVTNPAEGADLAFRLHVDLTNYFGVEHAWVSGMHRVGPSASVDVPLSEAVPEFGWWQMRPTIHTADGEGERPGDPRQVAYIVPVGPRKLPPEEGFWFGLDARVRTPEMLRLFAQLGIDILRFGTWGRYNPAEGEWRWDEFDLVVDAVHGHGMQVLHSVAFTPGWAVKPEYRGKGDPSRLPPRSDALGQAVRAMTEHTKSKGLAIYDLWNEPDHAAFWQGTTDEYLEFMRICYGVIKEVQPKATVLSGGIASIEPGASFHRRNPDLSRRVLLEGRRWYDAISLHEHGNFPKFAAALDGPLTAVRAELDDGRPLWLTETGDDGSPNRTARVLVQKFTFARARGAEGMIWYAMYAPGQGGRYNMVDAHGDPHPAIPAYSQMVRSLRGKHFSAEFADSEDGNSRLLSFGNHEETVFVGWGAGAATRQAVVEVSRAANVYLVNLMGNRQPVEVREGRALFPLDEAPAYLHVRGGLGEVAFEDIEPLALFEFGTGRVSKRADGLTVSDLEAAGWNLRQNFQGTDPRMDTAPSGMPHGVFDGNRASMTVSFTVTPDAGAGVDLTNLSFWSGGAGDVEVAYRIGEGAFVRLATVEMVNLAIPRQRAVARQFNLCHLPRIAEPVTFVFRATRKGERTIFSVNDLRLDGTIHR